MNTNFLKAIDSFRFYLVTGCLIFVLGCKSSKTIIGSDEANSKLTAKQVIKEHQNNEASFRTMQASLKGDIISGTKGSGMTFNFRMERDKVIWLSAPLGLARMMITPESVQFYNKTDNTYFDGDYRLLSDFVGVELDFNKVQNILLGQAIFGLSKPHSVAINNKSYALAPKEQSALIELFYLINPSHFKMNSLQMLQKSQKRFLQVDYMTYQNVDKEVIPQDIKIVAVENGDEVNIILELKSVTLNGDVRFPFNMPSGYKEIEIKN
jgi:hypothetical protein